jgi:hypothetical protein
MEPGARPYKSRGSLEDLKMASEGTIFEVQRTLDSIYTGGKCDVTLVDGRPALFMRAGSTFGLYDPITGVAHKRLILVGKI